MSRQTIRGHDDIVQRFRLALSRSRLASTFLFVGPAGIGKRTFALQLAQALLCETRPDERLDPCGACPSCHQVLAGTHPDVELIGKPADKAFIPVELFIGDADHRMRSGLCYNISLKPYSGRRKVAIIDDADFLNKEGANCLLKTLEEPPPKSVLILIGTSEHKQLPTIRSRCQVVRFQPLPPSTVAELLIEQQITADAPLAARAAQRSGGSLERAQLWCDQEALDFRRELLSALSQPDLPHHELTKQISQFVDAAGKDSAAKRQRMRLVVSMAEEFYRALLDRQLAGNTAGQFSTPAGAAFSSDSADAELSSAVSAAGGWIGSAERAAECLSTCLDTYGHLEANANQATLIEWWLDELGACARGAIAVRLNS